MKFYDWRKVLTLINGVAATNWAEGNDCFKAERLSPSAKMSIGADGKACISLSADKSVKVTLKFQQTSPTNAVLSALAAAEDYLEGFVPVQISQADPYRQDGVETLLGFIEKPADHTRGAEANPTEWTLLFPEGYIILGDPPFVGMPTALAEALG